MSTSSERQVHLEFESVTMGAQRYEAHRKAQGESATKPGMEQTKRALPSLAATIESFMESGRAGKAGRKHSAFPYLLHIAAEEAAYLTIRVAINGAAASQRVNAVAVRVGDAIQSHVNLASMKDDESADKEHVRRLYKKVLAQVAKATTERHRNGVWSHVLKKYRPEHLKWTEKDKLLLGLKLIELFEESCNLVRTQRQSEGRHDTPIYLVFTPEAEAWFAEAHEKASLWSPVHLPMLVPPRDWTSPFSGGYLTRAIRRARMVLSHSPGYLDELKNVDMPEVYAAVNAVQSTPWRINKPVLAVMEEARALGARYQSLFTEADEVEPVRPAGIPKDASLDDLTPDQREVLIEWKRSKAEICGENARRRSKRVAVAQKLYVAKRFAPEEAIYFPHYLDFRGRIYPFASYLNPQGDDVARGLLEFADGRALGKRGGYWLMVHIANLFGVDKVSFGERVKWTLENQENILKSASSPLDCEFWMSAENPWQALAACFEFAGWTVQGDDYVSHLPIAMDGSCSGLQHYSAMLRDPVGGAAVNLMPADKPGDIYTEVARRAQARIEALLHPEVVNLTTVGSCETEFAQVWSGGKIVRKIAKQPTMTYCYSATKFGMGKQIVNAVTKLGGEEYLTKGVNVRAASVFAAGIVRDAIGDTVVAAKSAMDFLQGVAQLAASKGLPIRWTAPSGFPVAQEYRESVGKVIDAHYAGLRVQLTIRKEGEKLDKKRQASGVAPNFVHACDSAHLMGTVNLGTANGLKSWACIHDSFGVHAADVDTLHACIREAFIEQYTPDVLEHFRNEIVEQLEATAPELLEKMPPLPAKGTLDLAAVRDAAYFFA